MLKRVEKSVLVPDKHSKPVGAYSPGIAISPKSADRMVFVTGQVATDAEGTVLCPEDPAGQTREVFNRIAQVLAEADATLNDLVSITIYVTDLDHFEAVSGVRNDILKDAAPSSTLVEVAGLVERGCLVEISGIAVR